MRDKDQKKFTAFKAASLADWEVATREELKGADPWKKLSIPLPDCTILPFYTKNDTNHPAPLIQVLENNFLGPRTWYNCPAVAVENENTANTLALAHLRNGADGIFFELNDTVNFKSLLKDIDLKYCSLNFLAKANPQAIANALKDFLKHEKKLSDNLPLCFYGNVFIPDSAQTNVFFSGFLIPSLPTPSEEITAAFRLMVEKDLKDIHSCAFTVNIGTDFFLSLAKLRAIRMIWKRLLAYKGLPENLPCFIHARSTAWHSKESQPHENMLKSTTAAMSAILGGCDALTLDPENDQSLSIRVARNVSNVLREESYFSKVADPVAGSYYVESLSAQLAEAAWKSITP